MAGVGEVRKSTSGEKHIWSSVSASDRVFRASLQRHQVAPAKLKHESEPVREVIVWERIGSWERPENSVRQLCTDVFVVIPRWEDCEGS